MKRRDLNEKLAHADAAGVWAFTPPSFSALMGGVDPAITKAQRVTIHTKAGPIRGVVGNVAPHLMRDEGDKEKKAPKIHDIFIDIGVPTRAEAEKLVRVGDPITLNDEFELLRNGLADGGSASILPIWQSTLSNADCAIFTRSRPRRIMFLKAIRSI